jgi:hypothetical protein
MFLLLVGSIGFVALGVWIGTTGGVPIWDVVIAAYIGVPFFAVCGFYAAYRLVWRRPALVIDSMGITDASSTLGAGHLSWDDVDHVRIFTYYGQPMLGIAPRSLELFLSRQHPVRRSLTKLNLRLGCAPVNVPQVALPMKLTELAQLLHARYGVRVERDA